MSDISLSLLMVKVTEERGYSVDLPQGGAEVAADFIYKSAKKELSNQRKRRHWRR